MTTLNTRWYTFLYYLCIFRNCLCDTTFTAKWRPPLAKLNQVHVPRKILEFSISIKSSTKLWVCIRSYYMYINYRRCMKHLTWSRLSNKHSYHIRIWTSCLQRNTYT